LLVVIANSLQLGMMVCFLVMLLCQLNSNEALSWFGVFSPLWASDAITVITSFAELRRIYHVPAISIA